MDLLATGAGTVYAVHDTVHDTYRERREYEMYSLLHVITDWCLTGNSYDEDKYNFTEREITLESRKVIDKIAVTMLRTEIDNAIIINGLLKLSKMERIIIVLNIMNDIALFEIAFLLNANMNSIYVQKKSALEKLRRELSEHFHCGILKYKEAETK